MEYTECSLIYGGGMGVGGRIKKSHYEEWYSIQYWVVPFTGWAKPFKYIRSDKPKYWDITKPKCTPALPRR
jgi:hypothetical protein